MTLRALTTRVRTLPHILRQALSPPPLPGLALAIAVLLLAGVAGGLLLGRPAPVAMAQTMPDTTPPTIVAGTTANPNPVVPNSGFRRKLRIKFSENLDATRVPLPGAFYVRVGSGSNPPEYPVKTVSINGANVDLDLLAPVLAGDAVQVTYVRAANVRLQDLAGNAVATFQNQAVTNQVAYGTDEMGMTIEGLPRFFTSNNPINIKVRFSHAADISAGQNPFTDPFARLVLTGATVGDFTESGPQTEYNGSLTPDRGNLNININEETFYDSDVGDRQVPSGNISATRSSDTTGPTVRSGSVGTPTDYGYYGTGDKITVVLTFSEPVVVTGTPRMVVDVGGTDRNFEMDRTYLGLDTNQLAFSWEVPAGVTDDDGIDIKSLSHHQTSTITDEVKNAATLTLPAGFAGVKLGHKVDGTAPTVTTALNFISSIPTASGYRAGDNIELSVQYSETVYVTGEPYVQLSLSDSAVSEERAVYNRGSGSDTIVFRYTVVAGDRDDTGVYVDTNSITLPDGAAIVDKGSNAAPITHLPILNSVTQKVDAQGPTITGVLITSTGPYGPDHSDVAKRAITFDVTFDEAVTWTGADSAITMGFRVGGALKTATYVAANQPSGGGKGTSALRFTHQVQLATGNGDVTLPAAPNQESVSNNITDLNGNAQTPAGRALPAIGVATGQTVDATAPTVGAMGGDVAITSGGWAPYSEGHIIQIAVDFSEAVTHTECDTTACMNANDPQNNKASVGLRIGSTLRKAYYASGSGTSTLVFEYLVTDQDVDTDGIEVPGPVRSERATVADGVDNTLSPANTLGFGVALTTQSGHEVLAPVVVTNTSPIIPTGITPGQKFRLLFVTSSTRNASDTGISTYNTYVQGRAGDSNAPNASVEAIRAFSGQFRAVGSTSAVDARDNTATTGTSVPIYWLTTDGTGDKVADDYTDFYDGNWDSKEGKDESGVARKPDRVWTGSNANGTKHTTHPLGNSPNVAYGSLTADNPGPLGVAGSTYTHGRSTGYSFYALSPVITVRDTSPPTVSSIAFHSTVPTGQDAYAIGDQIEVVVTWSEDVAVTGLPEIRSLHLGPTGMDATPKTLTYNRMGVDAQNDPDNTKTIFRYTVAEGDLDADGLRVASGNISGGTIKDTSPQENPANRAQTGISIVAAQDVDGVRPTITSVALAGTGPYSAQAPHNSIDFTITFNEEVDLEASGTPAIVVPFRIAGSSDQLGATYEGAGGSATLAASYEVTATTPEGAITVPGTTLTRGITTLKDGSGNLMTRFTYPAVTVPLAGNHRVDRQPPQVETMTIDSTGWYVTGQVIRVKVTAGGGKTWVVSGTPELILDIGGDQSFETAPFAGLEDDGATMVFERTVVADDVDADGISINRSITITGGATIADQLGNAVTGNSLAIPASQQITNARYHEINTPPGRDVFDVTGTNLAPDGLDASTGDQYFRLLFITTAERAADSADINVYNKLVQEDAAAGDALLRQTFGQEELDKRFRVLGSTPSVSALVNTYEGASDGVSVWWFRANGMGAKAIDDYGSFYPSSGTATFTSDAAARSGRDGLASTVANVNTGTSNNGEPAGGAAGTLALGGSNTNVVTGTYPDSPIDGGTSGAITRATARPYYALSPILKKRDTTGPAVEAIAITSAVDTANKQAYGIGDEIHVTVTWNEPVTITGAPTIELQVGAAPHERATYSQTETDKVQAESSTVADKERKTVFVYVVEEGKEDADGVEIVAGSISGGAIIDGSRNAVTTAGRAHGAVAAAANQDVEAVRPTIASIAITDITENGYGPISGRNTITFTVTFSEAVDVTETGEAKVTLPIRIGGTVVDADYVSGTGSTALTFEYTVVADEAPNGGPVTVTADSLDIAEGASVQDSSDNDANPAFSAMSTQPDSAKHNVDRAAPTFDPPEIVSTGWYVEGQDIRIRLTFNEPVTVGATNLPFVVLTLNQADPPATATVNAVHESSNANKTVLTFKYTVQATDLTDADGLSVTGPLTIPAGGSLQDDFGNAPTTLTFSALNNQSGHEVNWEPDVVDITGNTALIPHGVIGASATGDVTFRMLIITDDNRNGSSSDIGTYNAFVQGQVSGATIDSGVPAGNRVSAEATIAALKAYARHFRIVGSTTAVNARTNTFTRTTDTDLPIYWVRAAKVADDLGDFYDGSWDSENRTATDGRFLGIATTVVTGASHDGGVRTDSGTQYPLGGGGSPAQVGVGKANKEAPLQSRTGATLAGTDHAAPMLALSQRFLVRDTTGPKVATGGVSVTTTPTNTQYHIGEDIVIEVTFNEDVTPAVGQGIKIALTNDRTATYDEVRTNALRAVTSDDDRFKKIVFSYEVVEADDGGALTIPASGASNGGMVGSFSDSNNNPSQGSAMTFVAVDPAQNVDATRPFVKTVAVTSPLPTDQDAYGFDDAITFTATFSESVTWTGANPTLNFDYGSAKATATYDRGKDSATLIFTHTFPTPTARDQQIAIPRRDAINQVSPIMDLNGNTMTDDNVETAPTVADTQDVDITPPAVDSVTIGAKDPVNADFPLGIGEVLRVTVNFSEDVDVVTTGGTPHIVVDMGGVNVEADYASTDTNDASILYFEYTIAEDNADADGPSIAADQLVLNSGTIKDKAKNDADATTAGNVRHLPVDATANQVVDGVKPTVTIAGLPDCSGLSASAARTCGIDSKDPVTITIEFGEPVTGFTAGDVAVTAAARLDATFAEDTTTQGVVPGTVWTVDIEPKGTGSATGGLDDIVVTIAADAVEDGAENGNAETSVSHDPRPGPVQNVRITATTSTSYTVAWDHPDFGADGIRVVSGGAKRYRFQHLGTDGDVEFSATTPYTVTGVDADNAADGVNFNIASATEGDLKRSDAVTGTAKPPQAEIVSIATAGDPRRTRITYRYPVDDASTNTNSEILPANVVKYDTTPFITGVAIYRCIVTASQNCDPAADPPVYGMWVGTHGLAADTMNGIVSDTQQTPPTNGETVRYRIQFRNSLPAPARGDRSEFSAEHTVVDTSAPVIRVQNPVSQIAVATNRVFVATDDEQDSAETDWKYKLLATAELDSGACPATVPQDALAYTEGENLIISGTDSIDKYVCFWSTDSSTDTPGGNVGKAISDQIKNIDASGPSLVPGNPDQSAPSKFREFTVTGQNIVASTLKYKVTAATTTGDANCGTTAPSDATAYTSAVRVSSEGDNNKYVCFYAEDASSPPVKAVAASAKIVGIDTTKPTVNPGNPNMDTAAKSRTFSPTATDPVPTGLTASDNPLRIRYQVLTSGSCQVSPLGAEPWYIPDDPVHGLSFSSEADNGKFICFWAYDAADNVSDVVTSPAIARIDTTPPTLTVTFRNATDDADANLQTQPATRNRLVRARATDTYPVEIRYHVRTGACPATPFRGDNLQNPLRGNFDGVDSLYVTGAEEKSLVLRENGYRVCFFAIDTARNFAPAETPLTTGITATDFMNAITITEPVQTSVAQERFWSAEDDFGGHSSWWWARVVDQAACDAYTPADTDSYDERATDQAKADAEDHNREHICFIVSDDHFDDDGDAAPVTTRKLSAAIKGIDTTPPDVTVEVLGDDDDQSETASERKFRATYTDMPEPPSGVSNIITMKSQIVDPANPADAAMCPDAPPNSRDVEDYTPGDEIDFTDEGDVNKWVCFWATDQALNTGKNNSPKVQNLDTQGPGITVNFVSPSGDANDPWTVITGADARADTRNRLVRATATDATETTMYYEERGDNQCADSPFETGTTDKRTGVSEYAGSYSNTVFTPTAPVVVRTNNQYVCFWAVDSAAPPNITKAVSGRVQGVVAATFTPTITVTTVVDERGSVDRQTSTSRQRRFIASDNFGGASKWSYKVVDDTDSNGRPNECVNTLSDPTAYTERTGNTGSVVEVDSQDNNGDFVCFIVADDKYDDDGTANPDKFAMASEQIRGIDKTAPTIAITNPTDQSTYGSSRTYSATVRDEPATTLTNPIEMWYRKATPLSATATASCGESPFQPNGQLRDGVVRGYMPNVPDSTVERERTQGNVVFNLEADAIDGKWVCFWARDGAGNLRASDPSDKVQNIDNEGPTISITFQTYNRALSAYQEATAADLRIPSRQRFVRATAEDATTITMWYKVQPSSSCTSAANFDENEEGVTPLGGSYNAGTKTYTGPSLKVTTDGSYVCFWAKDAAVDPSPNTVLLRSDRISGVAGAPVITVSSLGNQNSEAVSRRVRATDNFNGDSVWTYKQMDSDDTCDSATALTSPVSYTEGEYIVLTDHDADDDSKNDFICFHVQDDSHPDRVTVAAQSAELMNINNEPVPITVTNPDQGTGAAERVFTAKETVASGETARALDGQWDYKIVAASEVNLDSATNNGFPCGPEPFTRHTSIRPDQTGVVTVTVTRSTDNDKYVCFWTKDNLGNFGSAISNQIAGIQAPDITVETNVVNPDDDDPDIGTTKSYEATDDVTGTTTMRYLVLAAADTDTNKLSRTGQPYHVLDANASPAETVDNVCVATAVHRSARNYREGTVFILDDEILNGQTLCFWTTDQDGDVGVEKGPITGIALTRVVTVSGNNGRSRSSISATDNQEPASDTTWEVLVYVDIPETPEDDRPEECATTAPGNAFPYVEGETGFVDEDNDPENAANLVFTRADNGKVICFWATGGAAGDVRERVVVRVRAASRAPGAPAAPTLTPGEGSLTATWSVPSSTGTARITAYDLRYSAAGGDWTTIDDAWTATGGGALSYTLSGLENGVEYEVQVRAVSSAGDGDWSPSGTGTLAPSEPEEPEPPADPCAIRAIAANTPVSGQWAAECESQQRSGRYARYYSFTLSEGGEVTIDLESDTDTYLYLRAGDARSGAFLRQNDDIVSGTNTNSQIEATLAAGTYTVEATTYNPGESGSFTLTVTTTAAVEPPTTPEPGPGPDPDPEEPADPCAIQAIAASGSVSGQWTAECESQQRQDRYAQFYSFTLNQESNVTIDLESGADTYLYLRSGQARSGSFLQENDDVDTSGGNYNSRIVATLGAGTYTIEATTYAQAQTGSFTLTLASAAVGEPPTDPVPGPGPDPDPDPEEPVDPCAIGTIAASGSVSGQWSAECESQQRNGSYARYYSFTLEEESNVTIDLESGADTYLYLRSGQARSGAFLQSNDDVDTSGGNYNSRIVATLDAGTYTIEATTYAQAQTGSFTLTLASAAAGEPPTDPVPGPGPGPDPDPEEPVDPCAIGTIAASGSVSGQWSAECESGERNGSYARYYSFTLNQESNVTIDLESGADTYLYLRSGQARSGSFLQENDDVDTSGGNYNSRIVATLGAGTYTIEATTYAQGQTGSFTLTLASAAVGEPPTDPVPGPGPDPDPDPEEPVDPCAIGSIAASGSVSGQWTAECESQQRNGSYARYYSFTLEEESNVTIDLESDTDTYLYLRAGSARSGSYLQSNDDVDTSGGNYNSRIVATLDAGTYTIEATTYAQGQTGSFTLTLASAAVGEPPTDPVPGPGPGPDPDPEEPVDPCAIGSIAASGSVSGQWSEECESGERDGSYARYYSFTLEAGGEVTIDLSSDIDTYLYLRAGSARSGPYLQSNDDVDTSGGNYNSRIVATLEPGPYTIEATTYDRGATGTFTLTVTGAGDGESPP